ncbi:unnamed protein product [Paramecium primaurelia]|uniref:IQ motif and ubiquitin-like domain-containing protein n=2 Tax=Paramecium TaxID=5884 RepID=A0A8S1YLF1_9CILI|nr:unnamed protein product [Paramecium primaurelia]CAD8211894.1 unnamed protein product [Paramecium pentaurelia]
MDNNQQVNFLEDQEQFYENDEYEQTMGRQFESVVVIKDEKGEVQKKYTLTIQIIKANYQKPYLGGLKNKKSGALLHHAFAQTNQYRREHKEKNHRDTQTHFESTKSTIMMKEFGTQMEKEDLFIDLRNDRTFEPKLYFTSEMWEERREEAALFIQRLIRGWFARRRTNALRQKKQQLQNEQLEKEEDFRRQEEVRHKKEIERRTNPRTKEDFQILYEELELWRTTEIARIKSSAMTEEEKRAALKQVLNKETDLLQTIDRLKIIANQKNKDEKINKFLKSISDPKKWLRKSDGRLTEVHTLYTTRARELMDIYNGLKQRKLSLDERLDILVNTKWTVKEWDCNLTREIVDLIDREADMLNRGRPEPSLEGLRQRLQNLFLQFIETPEFNPEAARFQKIPYEILKSTS